MAVDLRELLEAGVHFGHQTRRWNPKMRRFIHGERGGIYIIDLLRTKALIEEAQEFASSLAHRGGTVLFVGTKKQARDAVKDTAEAAGMPYVNHRWLGGLLTNFQTISLRIKRLHDLERYENEGQLALLPTRERLSAEADLAKLRANLGGVKHMQRPPDAMFVIDLKTELIAVREAQRLRIPIIGLVDTNCDPDGIEFVIPGNDDAIRSCAVVTRAIGDVVAEGTMTFRAEEDRARQEIEERQRREEEERQRREAEERAAREAAQRAEREAAMAAANPEAAATAEAAPAETAPAETAPAETAPAETAPAETAPAETAPAETAPAEAAPPEAAPAEAAPAAAETPTPVEAAAAAGHDRAAQETAEAQAIADAGRPQPDPEAAIRQSAETEVAPAQRDNASGGSPDPAPPASDHTPDPATPPADETPTEEAG
jgi:small subunit ribosomal protein S2